MSCLEYFCNENDKFWNKSDEELKNLALEDLKKLEIINYNKFIDAHVVRQKKAYPVYDKNYKSVVEKQFQMSLKRIIKIYF